MVARPLDTRDASERDAAACPPGSADDHPVARILRPMSTLREELHQLIDGLPESQVAPILARVRERTHTEDGDDEWALPDLVGALSSGKGDLSARSNEIALLP